MLLLERLFKIVSLIVHAMGYGEKQEDESEFAVYAAKTCMQSVVIPLKRGYDAGYDCKNLKYSHILNFRLGLL